MCFSSSHNNKTSGRLHRDSFGTTPRNGQSLREIHQQLSLMQSEIFDLKLRLHLSEESNRKLCLENIKTESKLKAARQEMFNLRQNKTIKDGNPLKADLLIRKLEDHNRDLQAQLLMAFKPRPKKETKNVSSQANCADDNSSQIANYPTFPILPFVPSLRMLFGIMYSAQLCEVEFSLSHSPTVQFSSCKQHSVRLKPKALARNRSTGKELSVLSSPPNQKNLDSVYRPFGWRTQNAWPETKFELRARVNLPQTIFNLSFERSATHSLRALTSNGSRKNPASRQDMQCVHVSNAVCTSSKQSQQVELDDTQKQVSNSVAKDSPQVCAYLGTNDCANFIHIPLEPTQIFTTSQVHALLLEDLQYQLARKQHIHEIYLELLISHSEDRQKRNLVSIIPLTCAKAMKLGPDNTSSTDEQTSAETATVANVNVESDSLQPKRGPFVRLTKKLRKTFKKLDEFCAKAFKLLVPLIMFYLASNSAGKLLVWLSPRAPPK